MIDAGDIGRAVYALLERERSVPASILQHINILGWTTHLRDGKPVSGEVVIEMLEASVKRYYRIRVESCEREEMYS